MTARRNSLEPVINYCYNNAVNRHGKQKGIGVRVYAERVFVGGEYGADVRGAYFRHDYRHTYP